MSYIPLRHNDDRRRTKQELELDGVRVRLWATYVVAMDRWMLDIRDAQDDLIIGGIPVVCGINLLLPFRYRTGMPQGVLYAFTSDRSEPTFATLDVSARLHYAEVTA